MRIKRNKRPSEGSLQLMWTTFVVVTAGIAALFDASKTNNGLTVAEYPSGYGEAIQSVEIPVNHYDQQKSRKNRSLGSH